VLDKSGVPGQPITYRAYSDEKPVFDCSTVKPRGQRVSAFYVSGSWLHLQGLEVTGVQVTIKTHTQSICFESQGSHNIFESLSMHDGQAIGIYHVRGSDNLFLNCDAWSNWDSTSEDGNGGNVDGFGCHPTKGSTGNLFRGCRAWFNSDDGADNRTDVDGTGHTLINNLSHGSRRDLIAINMSKCELSGNSFTHGLKLSDKDFLSLDESELIQPRQPNGRLPIINLLRPANGSPLIDAGVNHGLPFQGTKPDIGAIEQ
jgi:pectate lyase-like protein